MYAENLDSDKQQLRKDLLGSFFLFNRVIYEIRTSREFLISKPVSQESHFATVCRELEEVFVGNISRLAINIPPGWGKTTLLQNFIAWCMAHYPDSRFLYVSYSHDLAATHTHTIKKIMSLPLYKLLFDVHIRQDQSAKDFFETTEGGAIAAFGSASAITGRDSGLPGLDRFSGALICFPADQMINTNQGLIKIGDIVKDKMQLKVYSYNFTSRKIELKSIGDWHENAGDEILEINLSDGALLQCTPNHNIWTDNRGWVEAKDLLISDQLPSPSPYCSMWNSYKFSGFSLRNIKIPQYLKLFLGKIIKFAEYLFSGRNRGSCFFGNVTPFVAAPDSINGVSMDSVFDRQFLCAKVAFNNPDNVLIGMKRRAMIFSNFKSSMLFRVSDILSAGSILKIHYSIIEAITVKMSRVKSFELFAKKSPCNKPMNPNSNWFIDIIGKSAKKIISSNSKFFDFLRFNSKRTIISIKNLSFFGSDSPKARGAIKSLISRNRKPLLIRNVGHVENTYCITVEDNHNFFCGKSEDINILVSNCDDLHKPSEISSSTIRDKVKSNYIETMETRLRGLNVPVIAIGQRLHEEDIFSFWQSGADGQNWKNVIIKGLDENNNSRYPEVITREKLLTMKKLQPYVFSSQYQQEPIPAGGALFKEEWFDTLEKEPNILATFLTVDSSETEKTYNDATAMSFWGLYRIDDCENETEMFALHWLNCIEVWVEPKDLEETFLDFYSSCMRHTIKPSCAAIEKKSTGTTLLSLLKKRRGLQLIDIERNAGAGSKTDRFLDVQPYIAARQLTLPLYGKHNALVIKHMSKITANNTHSRDDIADTAQQAIEIALIRKMINIQFDTEKSDRTANIVMSNFNESLDLRSKRYGAGK